MAYPYIYHFTKYTHKITGEEIFRPIVPVRIISVDKSKSQLMTALLDTGADSCVFSKPFVDQLGYDFYSGGVTETGGVGKDPVRMWIHPFYLELLSPNYKEVVWKNKDPFNIPCVEHDSQPLLGFKDFLSNFIINFNHSSKRITINKPL